MRRFMVVLEREADGGFSAWVLDLPGCASQGDTHDEALANIREAISCHLEALRADGMPLPPPRASIESVDINEAA